MKTACRKFLAGGKKPHTISILFQNEEHTFEVLIFEGASIYAFPTSTLQM
jgi:hypothetical protein